MQILSFWNQRENNKNKETNKKNKLIIKNEKTTKIKRLQRLHIYVKGQSKFISEYDYSGSGYIKVIRIVSTRILFIYMIRCY